MLRLFDSFMESAPQLLFQLYVMCTSEAEKWSAWTGISAVASLVSLGWGVAAYSQAAVARVHASLSFLQLFATNKAEEQ